MFLVAFIIALGVCAAVDVTFDQDVAFRSTFQNIPKIATWEATPFSALTTVDSATHLSQSNDCFTIFSAGNLYTSARREKASKLALENSYGSWVSIFQLQGALDMQISSLNSKYDVFAMTGDNIVGLKLSTSGACDKVETAQSILGTGVSWGAVSAIGASENYLWIASINRGLSQVRISDGSVTQLSLPDMNIKSVYFVSAWNKLYVGTPTALYALSFAGDDQNGAYLLHHEWVTGVIDTVPLRFSYDSVYDALWLAESGAVHKLDKQGRWWRYGYHQGAPFGNVTTVTAVNGYVYVGSKQGLARLKGNSNPTQIDTLSNANENCNLLIDSADSAETAVCSVQADPWLWSYYAGNRYLPDDSVVTLVHADSASKDGSTTVLVATTTGLTYLETSKWTLAEKSAAFEQFQYPRHDRSKLTASCGLSTYGDLTTFYKNVGDNDGLWTGMHAIGEAYNFAVTGSQLARKEAWRAFEGLEMLQNVTGVFPTYPARTYCYVANNDAGCGSEDGNDRWHNSTVVEGVMWKGDTSSDEMNGHYAALPVLYDLVAQTAEEKQRVYTILDGLTEGLIKNDLYLIDPSTGVPTTWGFWNPKEVNGDPAHYSERGLNSLEILSYLATAYSVTRNAMFKDTFTKLVDQHGYVLNTMNVKIDNPDDDNHSDNELITLAYHAMFYSWQRISAETEPEFKEEMWGMVSQFVPSFERTWLIIGAEYSPLWTGIYAGVAAQRASPAALSHSVWSLRHWAMDLVDWPLHNSGRYDVTLEPFYSRDSTKPIMRQIRPPSERVSSHWNGDPFTVSAGSGYSEFEPAVWRLPYYLMLYYKLI